MRLVFRVLITGGLSVCLVLPGCGPEKKQSPKTDVDLPTGTASQPQTRQQRLRAATQLVEGGALEDADLAIRELLIEDPSDMQANALMLRVLLHAKDIDGAVGILDHMAQLDPARQADMAAHAANLLHQSGDSAKAITRLESLLTQSPEFDEGRRLLAKVFSDRGYMFDANEQLRKLIDHTNLTLDELTGLIFPARSWLPLSEIEGKSEQRWQQLGILSVAASLRINGNPRAAVECLAQSEVITGDLAAITLYGRTLAAAQMYRELEHWVSSAASECERYPDFWIACGNLALHEKNQAAIACFIEAIRREPHSMDAHYGLVESLETAGRVDLAEQFRERVVVLDAINRDVQKIRKTAHPRPQSFVDVATRLMSIGRSIEAIAWQELALSRFSPGSQQLKLIPSYKARILKEYPSGRDEKMILCKVDPARFAPATDWLAAHRNSASGNATQAGSQSALVRSDFPPVPAEFRNAAEELGISFRYRNASTPVEREFLIFQALGGGVACIDFDRDGMLDFYFGQAATDPPDGSAAEPNALFRNLDGKFQDVVAKASADDRGYTTGVSAGDWNQDGFPDLLIGNLGANRLLINQGDGTYRPHQQNASGNDLAYTTSVAMADLTGDALPDIVEVNYLDDPSIFEPIKFDEDGVPILPGPLQFRAAMDRILVSAGDGMLRRQPLGDQEEVGFSTGLALLVTDIDGRLGNEVFVANDLKANQLWAHPQVDGTQVDDQDRSWVDASVIRGVAYGGSGKPMACMGIAAADFDGNGRLDLHVTNFENEWSNQYMQDESGSFVDSTVLFKLDSISYKMLGFGCQAVDYDNNTIWDLMVGNGHIEDLTADGSMFAMPTQLLALRREGFAEQAVSGDDTYWQGLHFSRAMAKCDFNRDGRVDVVITDLKENVVLLENGTKSPYHWLQLELVGTQSERDAIGTQISAQFGSTITVHSVQTGDGYMSKNESVVFIGLGPARSVQQLRVRWPSGTEQDFRDLSGDKRWLLIEGHPDPWQQSTAVAR